MSINTADLKHKASVAHHERARRQREDSRSDWILEQLCKHLAALAHFLFAEGLQATCRKLLFARYFKDQYTSDNDDPCGTCDNCIRPSDQVQKENIGLEVWRIVRICDAACSRGGRLSFLQLCDLVRGLGGGTFGTAGKSGGKGARDKINVEDYGGKVGLSKDTTELVVAQLLADRFLTFTFTSTGM